MSRRTTSRLALCGVLAFAFAGSAARGDEALPAPAPDTRVAALVAQVSPARLRASDERLVGFGTRNLFSEQLHSRTRGVFAARDWLAAQFRGISKSNGGRLVVAFDEYVQPKTARTPRDVLVSSVIATLPGDDPARGIVVISSHYDSRNSDANDATLDAPGADDNGSGVSAVLESARILAGSHFPATLVFACFDGEEQGLFGSDHFAKTLAASGKHVEADLNNDIIGASLAHDGTSAPQRARLFSEALPAGADVRRVNALGSENDSPSRELARAVIEIDRAYVPGMDVESIYRADRFLRGGDQESFSQQGFPAVRFVEAHENFDHQHQNVRVENGVQYGDLLQYMDFDYLARVTQLNLAALATLALAPPAPQAQMLNRVLGYDTTLQWAPVPGAASYQLVWRATSDPAWTHQRDVGNVTSATLPLSKDDWIVAVRAVDAKGRASVAAYPEPVR
jgi:Zn-dependent M28 family amino/carboxypeptidase